MKNKIKAWLESIKAKAAEAVSVTIGDETWEGARYCQSGNERFYLVGMLPKDWEDKGSSKVYFTFDGKEYHVAAYLQDFVNLAERYREYHPFGNNWIMSLREHDAPDASQETPCKRQEMTVT